jgi:hypothetical protein
MSVTVLVDVGGGPAAAGALARAAKESRATAVPLRVVHAWQMSASPSGDASAFFSAASAADARALATRWVLDTLGSSAASVRWVLEMVEVPAAVALPSQLSSQLSSQLPSQLPSQPGGTA